MPRTNITEFSNVASENTDINSVNIAENCPASGINNALRELMKALKDVDTGSQALTALSVTGDLTVGDGHTIGNQSSNDNLLIKSSSGENIEIDSNNGSHIFKKNGTENFRVNDDGEVRVTDNIVFSTSGKGIHLGVTSATASNLLSDYEEGTWTPTLICSGATFQYSVQSAVYTKVGDVVHFNMYIQLDGAGNSFNSNIVTLSGFPFTSRNSTGALSRHFVHGRFLNVSGSGYNYAFLGLNNNASVANLVEGGDNVPLANLNSNNLSLSSGQIVCSGIYFTDS